MLGHLDRERIHHCDDEPRLALGSRLRESQRRFSAGCGHGLSWNVRYRTFPGFFSQMSKLYRARSLLYRRQILQVNIRWKALDEIYKIYMLLHRSDLNISEIFRHFFRIFWQIWNFCKKSLFLNFIWWVDRMVCNLNRAFPIWSVPGQYWASLRKNLSNLFNILPPSVLATKTIFCKLFHRVLIYSPRYGIWATRLSRSCRASSRRFPSSSWARPSAVPRASA